MAENSGRDGGWTLLTFLAGLLVGASIALLVAPASGEEMRKKIKEAGEKGFETIAQKAREHLKREKEELEEEEMEEEEKVKVEEKEVENG